MRGIIGLDIGRHGVKVCTGSTRLTFPAIVGEGRKRKMKTEYAKGYEVYSESFNDKYYFVGTLAENESDDWRYMMTDDKAHEDTLILALVGIHHAGIDEALVVTGLPVELHDDPYKERFKQLLRGRFDITVNGVRKIIRIEEVQVAVEGGGAFWSQPQDGLIRLIDAGSKTVNYITMYDRRYRDRDSGMIDEGFGTRKNDSSNQFAKKIAGVVGKKWKAEDKVWVSGGRAEELAELLKPYYPNSWPLNDSLYANAIGFYNIGRVKYGTQS